MVPLVPNIISSPLSAWQVKLPSVVPYLEQLAGCVGIQLSATKSMHPIISSEMPATIGQVPGTIDE
jgi:hypothetical protein